MLSGCFQNHGCPRMGPHRRNKTKEKRTLEAKCSSGACYASKLVRNSWFFVFLVLVVQLLDSRILACPGVWTHTLAKNTKPARWRQSVAEANDRLRSLLEHEDFLK